MVFREVVRPILFRLDAEQAHRLTLDALAAVAPVVHRARGVRLLEGGRQRESGRPGRTTVFGVDFPSRVGLAAGLDKDGVALPVWPALGFGFVEVGTVTARPQPGNARPRLFRLRSDEAIVNRMGFNNAGAAALAVRLERLRRTGPLGVPLGISLGKSKATPIEDSVDDYLTSLRLLHRYADYVAVNVSSPNTPGLRSLQDAEALAGLVRALVAEATQLAGSVARPAPVLVKIAPDLTDGAVEELVDVCLAEGASGVIAANTTTGRGELRHEDRSTGQRGGLSGPPLLERAVEIVARVSKQAGERLPVIGVGGVSSADDARRMIDAGASLVQIYTGLIYQGPRLVRSVGREIG